MPSKHIPEATWIQVENATVEAVKALNRPIKDTDVLNYLILKGLNFVSEQDWRNVDAWEHRNESQK